jgi:Ca-activated chloride channel family protein
VVYNHPMARVFVRAAVAAFIPLSVGLAFQSSVDGPISIVPAVAKRTGPAELMPAAIRVDSSLVLIPAHVTNAIGAAVTDLAKDDFHLFEDNIEQHITHFAREDSPISIGLLFDTSGSMHNKMGKASEAAAAFFKTANPEDEFFLVEFGDKPKLVVPFTTDAEQVYRKILSLKPFGRTSLLDAIHLALARMKGARNSRKALVIFSDGGDNCSRQTASQIKNALVESDIQLYAMGIFDADFSRKHTPAEERDGPKLLDQLAAQTGGRDYPVSDLQQLPAISAHISKDLRTEYVLGYSPSSTARDGKYHRVRVTLAAPDKAGQFRTFYRQGYYSPTDPRP